VTRSSFVRARASIYQSLNSLDASHRAILPEIQRPSVRASKLTPGVHPPGGRPVSGRGRNPGGSVLSVAQGARVPAYSTGGASGGRLSRGRAARYDPHLMLELAPPVMAAPNSSVLNRPGPATPQHRSRTETSGAMSARRASARISPARIKLSCPMNSPEGYAGTRARARALAIRARSSCFTVVHLEHGVRLSRRTGWQAGRGRLGTESASCRV
jgi:hypothetical protein